MLKEIQFPAGYGQEDRARCLALLDRGRAQTLPYDGAWTAGWLLNDLHADVWLLRTNETRYQNGRWHGVKNINWKVSLANGTYLTDASNRQIREAAQKAAFLVRFLPNNGLDSISAHSNWIYTLNTFIQWLYLHEDLYQPSSRQLSLVDEEAITDFIQAFARGGVGWALQYPQRCLRFFYRSAFGREPDPEILSNVFHVPQVDQSRIVEWLDGAGYFTRNKYNASWPHRYISASKLASHLRATLPALRSRLFSAFLRQFEPEILDENSELLLPSTGYFREHPSHNMPKIADVIGSRSREDTVIPALRTLTDLFRLHRHLPDALPSTEGLKFSKAREIVRRQTSSSEHTPWVPLKTALAYTTEGLRWIVNWGEPLVDFYIETVKMFWKRQWIGERPPIDDVKIKKELRENRDEWVQKNIPDSLRELNISGWTTVFKLRGPKSARFSEFQKKPSLNDALQVLVGAAIVLIGITKPMRESEIRNLRRDCLVFVQGDGYWIEQQLRKANACDYLHETAKPIPTVVARAVRLLARLGEALSELVGETDNYARNALFYLPSFKNGSTPNPRVLEAERMKHILDRFCDFVALEPDSLGRRWYIRTHELRKSFLITFFWSFRFSSLDAARWVAGHRDLTHVYAYIQANFPGEELPQLEAEYAARQLWDFEQTDNCGETENIGDLYCAVCGHFGVNEITLIREDELREWLEMAFAKQFYRIEPFRIETKDGLVKVEIAFRIREEGQS